LRPAISTSGSIATKGQITALTTTRSWGVDGSLDRRHGYRCRRWFWRDLDRRGQWICLGGERRSIALSFRNQIHVIAFKLSGSPGSVATVQIGSASTLSDISLSAQYGYGLAYSWLQSERAANVYLQFINENSDTITVSALAIPDE
jgi:hypothetical protein